MYIHGLAWPWLRREHTETAQAGGEKRDPGLRTVEAHGSQRGAAQSEGEDGNGTIGVQRGN